MLGKITNFKQVGNVWNFYQLIPQFQILLGCVFLFLSNWETRKSLSRWPFHKETYMICSRLEILTAFGNVDLGIDVATRHLEIISWFQKSSQYRMGDYCTTRIRPSTYYIDEQIIPHTHGSMGLQQWWMFLIRCITSWDVLKPSRGIKRRNLTPPKIKDTQNDGPWKRWLLLNMAFFGIYVEISGE